MRKYKVGIKDKYEEKKSPDAGEERRDVARGDTTVWRS